MNRLPGYDHPTGRSELVMFSSLGSAAVALIGFAVFDATRFASERDCIVARLSGEPMELIQAATPANTNHAFTNFTAIRGWMPEAHLPVTPVRLVSPYGS
jgi:hypothetical protein